MILFDPKTGRWSDEPSPPLCSWLAGPGMVGGSSTPSQAISVVTMKHAAGAGNSSLGTVLGAGDGVAAGSLLIISGGIKGSRTLTGVSDTKGNVYTVDKNSGGAISSFVATCPNCIALANGDTVTCTFSGIGTQYGFAVSAAVNMATSSPLDKAAGATGTSTSPSATTAATAHSNDLVIGVLCWDNTGPDTVTNTNGLTLLDSNPSGGIDKICSEVYYKIVAATGAQAWSPTLSSSIQWGECLAAYKGVI